MLRSIARVAVFKRGRYVELEFKAKLGLVFFMPKATQIFKFYYTSSLELIATATPTVRGSMAVMSMEREDESILKREKIDFVV